MSKRIEGPGQWDAEPGDRVRYSAYGMQQLRSPRVGRSNLKQRLGRVVAVSRTLGCVEVLWDDRKTTQSIYTGFLDSLSEDTTDE